MFSRDRPGAGLTLAPRFCLYFVAAALDERAAAYEALVGRIPFAALPQGLPGCPASCATPHPSALEFGTPPSRSALRHKEWIVLPGTPALRGNPSEYCHGGLPRTRAPAAQPRRATLGISR